MSKSSLDYWREREEEANRNAIKDEAAYNKRIKEIYSYTERNIQRTINDFYARYASKEGITMNEARKRVREIDMQLGSGPKTTRSKEDFEKKEEE